VKASVKISICIPVYNQQQYVLETIQSVINQRLTCDCEIIVGDDASSDGTPSILIQLQQKYPKLLVIILRQRNIGPGLNAADLYRRARGEYIAHLDGDDLMLPGKLSRQIEIMDSDERIVICSHDVVRRTRYGDVYRQAFLSDKFCDLSDLYRNLPFFANSSKVFRNKGLWGDFSCIHNDMADFEWHIHQARMGNIYHCSQFLGVYRADIGITAKDGKLNPILASSARRVFSEALAEGIPGILGDELRRLYAKKILSFALHSLRLNNIEDAKSYASESISIAHCSGLQWLTLMITKSRRIFYIVSRLLRYVYDVRTNKI